MHGIHFFGSGVVADEMAKVWGDNLGGLNLAEKYWLLRAFLGAECDWTEANDAPASIIHAEEALIEVSDMFKANILQAFTKYLVEEPKPLTYYLSSVHHIDWINSAVESWGEHLEYIPVNSGLQLLFNIATDLTDFDNVFELDDLHKCYDAYQQEDDETRMTLILAVADVAWSSLH